MKIFLLVMFCFCYSGAKSQIETNVYFESGSDQIAAKYKDMLRKLAADFSNKEVTVLVRGYTDTTGTAEQNRILALKREAAVTSFLSEFGINTQQVGTACDKGNLSDKKLSNAENRRVSVTIDELLSYPSKNGLVVMAPSPIKLRIINKLIDPNSSINGYRNKDCQRRLIYGHWFTDVAIETAADSCSYILVKVPDNDGTLPVLFSGSGTRLANFRSYATTGDFKLFKVPLYSDYISLDRSWYGDNFPMTFLDIVIPKNIHPVKEFLSNECITIPARFIKDTVHVEYDIYAGIDWRTLALTVKTRDTVYKVPMYEFEILSQKDYSGGLYVLRLPRDREALVFREKQKATRKKRSFWQWLADLFR